MNTLFIGGSRHVSRLPTDVKKRLDNVISSGHRVFVGDANGADKAVQKYFYDAAYDKVTVFCSGDEYRNNLGNWATNKVYPSKHLKGFHFYAAKDREMAKKADFGLMIWDGKSAGTVLNVLRLVRAGKIVVLFNVPAKRAINIKTITHWEDFLSQCSPELRRDVRERATPEEWIPSEKASFLDPADKAQQAATTTATSPMSALGEANEETPGQPAPELYGTKPIGPNDLMTEKSASLETSSYFVEIDTAQGNHEAEPPARAEVISDTTGSNLNDLRAALNNALAESDAGAVVDILGKLAKMHRMTQVAKETGLARESLYRSLASGGNPEFATVLKVLSSLGFRLAATAVVTNHDTIDSQLR